MGKVWIQYSYSSFGLTYKTDWSLLLWFATSLEKQHDEENDEEMKNILLSSQEQSMAMQRLEDIKRKGWRALIAYILKGDAD